MLMSCKRTGLSTGSFHRKAEQLSGHMELRIMESPCSCPLYPMHAVTRSLTAPAAEMSPRCKKNYNFPIFNQRRTDTGNSIISIRLQIKSEDGDLLWTPGRLISLYRLPPHSAHWRMGPVSV